MYFFRSPQVRCMGGLVTRRKPSPVSHSSQAVFHSSPAQKTRHLFSQLPSKNTKGNRTRQRKFFCFSLCEFECRSEREGTRQAGGRRSSLSACRRDTDSKIDGLCFLNFFLFDRPLLTRDWKSESVTNQPTNLLTGVGSRDTCVSKKGDDQSVPKCEFQHHLKH